MTKTDKIRANCLRLEIVCTRGFLVSVNGVSDFKYLVPLTLIEDHSY